MFKFLIGFLVGRATSGDPSLELPTISSMQRMILLMSLFISLLGVAGLWMGYFWMGDSECIGRASLCSDIIVQYGYLGLGVAIAGLLAVLVSYRWTANTQS